MLDMERVRRRVYLSLVAQHPIVGVSGTPPEKIRLDFAPGTPKEDQVSAYAALALIDWCDETAQAVWEAQQLLQSVPPDINEIRNVIKSDKALTSKQSDAAITFLLDRAAGVR